MLLNSSFFSSDLTSLLLSSETISIGAELVPFSFLLNKNYFFGYMFLLGAATDSFFSSTGPNLRIYAFCLISRLAF